MHPLKHFKDWFRSQDFYGEPIQLTFKGDSTYKTTIGAMISVTILGILVAYAGYLASGMFGRTQSTFQNSYNILDLNTVAPFSPSDVGFDLAFGVGAPLNASYGYYSVSHVHYYYDDNGVRTKVK